MKTSESIVKISKALVEFQGEMESVKKGAVNPFFHSKYADLASIIAAIKEPMVKHELAYLQDTPKYEHIGKIIKYDKKGNQGEHTQCIITLTTRIIHASGEWIESDCILGLDEWGPQEFGKLLSYARRYGLQAALGLSAEDDDAESGTDRRQPVQAKPAAPPQAESMTDAQRKLIHKTRTEKGMSDEELKVLLFATFGYTSGKQCQKKDVDKLLQAIADWQRIEEPAKEAAHIEDDNLPFD